LRKRPIISFSIFVYLISLASVSTVVSALPGMMADRYLLIPSIGFSILVSYLLLLLSKNSFNGKSLNEFSLPLKAILLLICIAYSGITIARNFDWKDRVTLFSKDIENVSNSAQARNLYAVHLALKAGTTSNTSEQTKWREEACVQFKKALDIYPEFMNASFDLGRTLVQLNRYDEAMAEFKNTIRIKPTFSEPYSNIAVLLDAQNKFAEAIPYYKKAIEIRPKLMVYANLSFDYFRLNDFENSLAVSRDASKDFPNAYQPYFNMAKVFMRMGARDSAIANFEKAYRYNENDYSLVSTLYAMYAERNDPRASYFGERLKLLPKPQTGNFINQK
jgi:tetratricopeptide (TPR) repeat protein